MSEQRDAGVRSAIANMLASLKGEKLLVRARALAKVPADDPITNQFGREYIGEDTLSERELQVVTGYSHGMTDRMIADHYGLGENTVKSHGKHIKQKLNAHDRGHAACIALRHGLIN